MQNVHVSKMTTTFLGIILSIFGFSPLNYAFFLKLIKLTSGRNILGDDRYVMQNMN